MKEEPKNNSILKCMIFVIGILCIAIVFRINQQNEEAQETFYEQQKLYNEAVEIYNEVVNNFNAVVEEYEAIIKITSVENLSGFPDKVSFKDYMDMKDEEYQKSKEENFNTEIIYKDIASVEEETREILYLLLIAQQITNPEETWIVERLSQIDEITDIQAVTEDNDPNKLLNVEGGYTTCVYFAVDNVDQSLIVGKDTLHKGTDAGGAIEVYANVSDARNRCEYLGQFDNTLLYSGSYAILGTMVIRTSYQLTNEQQMELTNKIAIEFTELE